MRNLQESQPKSQQREMPFQVHQHSIVISWDGLSLDLRKLKVLINMPPPKIKKELQPFPRTIIYISKSLLVLRKLTSVRSEWLWNGTYQDLYDKAKKLITKHACMKFYDSLKPLYFGTDASGIGLGASLL